MLQLSYINNNKLLLFIATWKTLQESPVAFLETLLEGLLDHPFPTEYVGQSDILKPYVPEPHVHIMYWQGSVAKYERK